MTPWNNVGDGDRFEISLPREIRDHIPEDSGARIFEVSKFTAAGTTATLNEQTSRFVTATFVVERAGIERFPAPMSLHASWSVRAARQYAIELLKAAEQAERMR